MASDQNQIASMQMTVDDLADQVRLYDEIIENSPGQAFEQIMAEVAEFKSMGADFKLGRKQYNEVFPEGISNFFSYTYNVIFGKRQLGGFQWFLIYSIAHIPKDPGDKLLKKVGDIVAIAQSAAETFKEAKKGREEALLRIGALHQAIPDTTRLLKAKEKNSMESNSIFGLF